MIQTGGMWGAGQGMMAILLDAALKSALVLVVAGLVVCCLRRSSAAARHLVWFVAVASLPVLPVLSWALPGWHVLPRWMDVQQAGRVEPRESEVLPVSALGNPVRPKEELAQVEVAQAARQNELPAARLTELPRVTASAPARRDFDLRRLLLPVWGVGIGLALLPVLMGMFSLWRLERMARRETEPLWLDLLRRLMDCLGFRRGVALLKSERRRMPMTWGVLRPKLLLPEEAEEWPEGRRRVVLLHELAHAKRWDYATNLVTQLACAVYWFNPLVWFAARRMVVERERACDDIVLGQGAKPSDYAEQVLQIAAGLTMGRFAGYGGIPMARASKLEGRLRAILDGGRNRATLTRVAVLGIVTALTFLTLVVSILRAGQDGGDRGIPSLRFGQGAKINDCVATFKAGNAATISSAVWQLAAMGPAVAPRMIELLSDGQTDKPALRVLEEIATNAAVQQLLRDTVESGNVNEKHCCLLALGASRNPEQARFVAVHLVDAPIPAAVALQRLGGPTALKYLLEGFNRVDGEYWHVLASEVGEMNDPSAIEPLKTILARVELPPTGRFPPATAPTLVRVIGDLQKTSAQTASSTGTMVATREAVTGTNAVTNDQWSFGPVMERTMPDFFSSTVYKSFLDLETGELVTNHPPGDLGLFGGESDSRVRHAMDMVTVGVASNRWDATAEEVLGELAKATPHKQARLGGLESRRTFFFKTREGAAGILQVLPEEQGVVWIRYKLIAGASVASSRSAGTAAQINWGEAVEGLQVSLGVKKVVWTTKEFPVVTGEVRNTGSMAWQTSASDFAWRVELDGVWYCRRFISLKAIIPMTNIVAGASITDLRMELSDRWLMTAAPGELGAPGGGPGMNTWDFRRNPPQLGPGKHKVRFGVLAQGPASAPGGTLVASAPVEIEIVADLQEAGNPKGNNSGEKSNWGEAVEGVQVKLQAERTRWGTNETPVFHADLKNTGESAWWVTVNADLWLMEVDGVWYSDVFGPMSPIRRLEPDQPWTNILVSLEADRQTVPPSDVDPNARPRVEFPRDFNPKALKLGAGKHIIRIGIMPKRADSETPQRVFAVSRPVEIEVAGGAEEAWRTAATLGGFHNDANNAPAAGGERADWGAAVEGVQVKLRPERLRWGTNETPVFNAELRNDGKSPWRTSSNDRQWRIEVDGVWYLGKNNSSIVQRIESGKSWTNATVLLGANWQAAAPSEVNPDSYGAGGGGGVPRDFRRDAPKLGPGKHTVRFGILAQRGDTGVPRAIFAVSEAVEIEMGEERKEAKSGLQEAVPGAITVQVLDAETHAPIPEFIVTPTPREIGAASDILVWDTNRAAAGRNGVLTLGYSTNTWYQLKVEAPGYMPEMKSRRFFGTNRLIELRRGEWISGRVVDWSGGQGRQAQVAFNVVAGRVTVDGTKLSIPGWGLPGIHRSPLVETDPDGRFSIRAVAGIKSLMVSGEGGFAEVPRETLGTNMTIRLQPRNQSAKTAENLGLQVELRTNGTLQGSTGIPVLTMGVRNSAGEGVLTSTNARLWRIEIDGKWYGGSIESYDSPLKLLRPGESWTNLTLEVDRTWRSVNTDFAKEFSEVIFGADGGWSPGTFSITRSRLSPGKHSVRMAVYAVLPGVATVGVIRAVSNPVEIEAPMDPRDVGLGSFGPMILREMPLSKGTSPEYFDFESAAMVTNLPPGDLMWSVNASNQTVRYALDMATVRVDYEGWDATPSEVLDALGKVSHQQKTDLGGRDYTFTYFFKTREGMVGIMQTQPPGFTKQVLFKVLEREKATGAR